MTRRDDAPELLLSVRDLAVHFPVRSGVMRRQTGTVRAVDGVSFDLAAGETLGLVGESGCGKSTAGLSLVGLVQPTQGSVRFAGEDVTNLQGTARKAQRRRMQIVFQDPYASLNPRARVRDLVRAPLDIHGIGSRAERREQVASLLARVGLRPDQAGAYPHQFSGGQRQRIGIARALALAPDIVVCDEPVSALDLSVQAQILNLLVELQRERKLAYLFISHDLAVVEHIAHRVAVMYLGRIVELADRAALFAAPRHPYTELLLRSAPASHPRARKPMPVAADDMPSATRVPPGCRFHTRCPIATERCRVDDPALTPRDDGRLVACHYR